MSRVFVKGYMRNSQPVSGYTRRQTLKARFILNRLNKRRDRNLLLQNKGYLKTANIRIERDMERSRRIINKYF